MGASQSGRSGADHGYALAGGRRTLERMFAELCVVHGITLQQTDQHWRAFLAVVAHAGLLAQYLGRAHPGTTATKDIGRKNFLRSTLDVFLLNIANKRRDIYVAGAGVDAWRVVAVQAA